MAALSPGPSALYPRMISLAVWSLDSAVQVIAGAAAAKPARAVARKKILILNNRKELIERSP